ncbi:hypothetical protein LHFGNBLO_001367 [Mesorhizobium sp. AR10]|uniref:hypothetical protein n=1 Tax=Mesorhizobium sp. AR10 TaxID=2865839 RepID=UPI00215EB8F9|nr:hypothetical protein [Mesorhizobium sp. AR10]UVK39952.1 hypothetical protein LHFGNBLO_001367 [Mesorhizobium sp. AR10]
MSKYREPGVRVGESADETRLATSYPVRLRELIKAEAKARSVSEATIVRECVDFAFSAKSRAAALEREIFNRD